MSEHTEIKNLDIGYLLDEVSKRWGKDCVVGFSVFEAGVKIGINVFVYGRVLGCTQVASHKYVKEGGRAYLKTLFNTMIRTIERKLEEEG